MPTTEPAATVEPSAMSASLTVRFMPTPGSPVAAIWARSMMPSPHVLAGSLSHVACAKERTELRPMSFRVMSAGEAVASVAAR